MRIIESTITNRRFTEYCSSIRTPRTLAHHLDVDTGAIHHNISAHSPDELIGRLLAAGAKLGRNALGHVLPLERQKRNEVIDEVRIDHGRVTQATLHIVRGSRQDVIVVGQAGFLAGGAALQVLEQFLADLDAAGVRQEYEGGLPKVQLVNVVVVVHQAGDCVKDAGRNFVHLVKDEQRARTNDDGSPDVVVEILLYWETERTYTIDRTV